MGKITSTWTQEGIVIFFRAIPYLCAFYFAAIVGANYMKVSLWRLPLVVEFFMLIEVAFLFYIRWRWHVLSRCRPPPQLSLEERETLFKRLLTHTDDMKAMISGWFLGVPFEDLRKEDLQKFITWMLFSKNVEEVEDDSEEKEAVEKAMIAVQAAAGHDLACRAPGEKEHPVMRHSLDPIKYKHRPFIVYLATHCFVNDIVGALIMRSLGFRKYHTRHLSYWHRPGSYSLRQRKMDDSNSNRTPHTSPTAQQQVPIVFVHGIGLGLTLYAEFIRYFTTRTDIFLLELPHASLKVWEFVPTSSQTVDSILEMLNTHGFEKAVFAAHSLGSVYVSWMCRYASHAVAASVFIEPICFMLFLRTLTFNFLYQEYGGFVGFLIRSEFFLNHALRRHFWWQSKILWAEDIHHPCHIFLCHQDEVVPTQEVVKYIATHDKAHHITTEMIDDDFHGSWLFKPNIYAHVAETIENVWMSCSSSPFSSLSTEAPSTRLTKSKRKMRFIPAYGLVRKGYIYLTRRQRRSRGQEQRDSDLAQRKGKINRIAPAFS